MIINLLAFCSCAINLVGLLTFMSSIAALIDLYKHMSRKHKVAAILGTIAVTQLIVYTHLYMILFLAAEYTAVLVWYKRQNKPCLNAAIRGVVSMILLLLTELALSAQFYYQGIERMTASEVQVISYMGMAAMQCCLVIMNESRNVGRGSKRALIMALEVRAVENLVWLAICVRSSMFEYDYLLLTAWFVFTILMCYIVCFLVQFRTMERGEIERRADIHVNTYEYYLHMEEEHLRIRKLYHDMKNQLMILENNKDVMSGVHADQVQVFADKLNAVGQFYHTGFPSLDILLYDGKMKAEAKNIEFEAVVSEGSLSFMKEEDVNVIFSNALINAIEACEKIIVGRRLITVKAGKNLDDTLIYVKNTVAPTREKGSLHTSKPNKRLHGIGMTSIQECAEKYGGYVSIIEEDNTFQLAILFGGEQK